MAGLNPVDVQLTLEPPLTNYMPLNSAATLRIAIMDALTKQLVAPDGIAISSLQPPQRNNPYGYAYFNDGVGLYHAFIAFTSADGKWLLQVQCTGNPGAIPVGSATLVVNVYPAGN